MKSDQLMIMSVQIKVNSINSKNCFIVVRWEKGCFGHVLTCPSPFGNHLNMRDTKTQLVFCTVLHLSVQPSLSHESFEVKGIFLKPCLKSCFLHCKAHCSTFQTFFPEVMSVPLLLIISCALTARSPCTGSHAADICVQAGPSDMAFTTPHWVSLGHLYPLPSFLTDQVLLISVHMNVCLFMCVSVCFGTFNVCVFKPCPDQPPFCMPVACVHR